MQQDLERLAVGGKHHELGLTTVQSLGRLICPLVMRYFIGHVEQKGKTSDFNKMQNMNYLAQLLIIGSLLDKIEDLGGERLMMKC